MLRWVLSAGLVLSLTIHGHADLRAGAAAVDVSPTKLPVIVNGGFLPRVAHKVIAPLYARAIVLDDGDTKLAMVVVDSCMVPRGVLDNAKTLAAEKTNIPVDRMLISATHTHSAPSAFGALGTPSDPDYPGFLTQRIADAIIAAHDRLAPAEIGAAVIDADRFTALRRWVLRPDKVREDPFGNPTVRASMHTAANPDNAVGPTGPEDPDLSVISVRTAEGQPLALLANFANHYVGAPMLSPDYFGLFADRIGPALGIDTDDKVAPFVGVMSQGTSGDVWLRDYFQPDAAKWRPNIDAYADGMVQLAAEAYRTIEHRSDVTLAMRETTLNLHRRAPDAQRLAWAKNIVDSMGDRDPKNKTEVYARSAIKLHNEPTASLKLQAIRIGDFAVTAMPNEVYALSGLKLKLASPLTPTINIELANGAEGYIPPPEQYILGGYNTWPAMSASLETHAEPKIVETVTTLLEQVAGKPRRVYDPVPGPAAQAVIDEQPVAYWRMHEWEGPTARDAVAGHHAAYEDGVVYFLEGPAPDRFHTPDQDINRAAHFAGGRMQTRVPKLDDQYTVELWFWNGMVTDARSVTGYMFSRGHNHAPGAPGDHIGLGGTYGKDMAGKVFFYNGDDRAQVLAGKTPIERWTWHHLVFTRDGQTIRVYLDGKLEIDGEADMTLPAGVDQLFIGGRNDGFATWEGRLDEVAVYDRVLSAEQAAKHYTAAIPPKRAAAPKPDSEPRTPAETIGVTHLRDGYTMQLVAAEPLVRDPVAIDWGPDGKLWVVEMADYPVGMTNDEKDMTPGGRVRCLEDVDGDGVYDKSTLFADDLNFPNGILVWGDGVLVTATTDIVYLEDTDGDGKADVRASRFSGFLAGNPQLRVNGLRYGLDNWVYCANGLRNKATIRSVKTGEKLTITGRDVRLRPDTGAMDTAAGPSQFGRSMNDFGQWFGVDNSRPIWHVVLEDQALRRNPHAALPDPRHMLIDGRNPPVFARSRFIKRYDHPHRGSLLTSACSTIVYRDELLFDRTQQHAFSCEPYHNLVLGMTLESDGVSYAAQLDRGSNGKREFLASEDGWFRPVQVRTGPDGALWVVDMYRYLIEHPHFMPSGSRDKLKPFYRMGEDRGRIYRVFKRDARPRRVESIHKMTTEQLVAELEHPSGTRRDLVQRMLVRRKDQAAVAPLRNLLHESKQPIARLHALGTLRGLGALSADDTAAALADVHPMVRRLAVELGDAKAIHARLAKLTDDPDPRVRLTLATRLGAEPDLPGGVALAKLMATAGHDPYQRAAVVSSYPVHLKTTTDALAPHRQQLDAQLWGDLAATAAGAGQGQAVMKLLDLAMDEQVSVASMQRLTPMLASLRSQRDKLKSKDSGVHQRLSTLLDAARALAGSSEAPLNDRRTAIGLLGVDPLSHDQSLATLASLLDARQPADVQTAAAEAIAATGSSQTPTLLLDQWSGAGPALRAAILDVLVSRTGWSGALLDAVEAGKVKAASISPAYRQRLTSSRNKKLKQRAEQLLAAGDSNRTAVIERYAAALNQPGDATRGASVFESTCAVCHRVGEVGKAVGPDLLAVTDRSGAALLESILDPNRAVEPRYMAYIVTLTDGSTVLGLIQSETGASVTLVDAVGKQHTFARTRIASMTAMNQSLMPVGLESAINEQQMADLIRFLQTAGS